MYEKNKNFCSGYFPSFITINDLKYTLISQNNHPSNISDNYYLKTQNNKYLKQVINKHSKYNLEYIIDLKNRCQDTINKDTPQNYFALNHKPNKPNNIKKSPKIDHLAQVNRYTGTQVNGRRNQFSSLQTETYLVRETNYNQNHHTESIPHTENRHSIKGTPCKKL